MKKQEEVGTIQKIRIMKNAKVVLVDKKDNVLGKASKLNAHTKPFPLHRAISVLIFNSKKDKVLIQKRSKSKPTWPLSWSNTCCTHPQDGESYLTCAKRRLREEMGIDCHLRQGFKFIYKAVYDGIYAEHELDRVFLGEYVGKIKPDLKEVADYQWIEVARLKLDIKKNPEKYTPWFKIILQRLKMI